MPLSLAQTLPMVAVTFSSRRTSFCHFFSLTSCLMVHQCCQSCPSQKASLPSPLKIHTNKLIPFLLLPTPPSLFLLPPYLSPHFLFIVPNVKQKQDVLNQVSLSPMGSACCVVSVSADCMHILSTNIT